MKRSDRTVEAKAQPHGFGWHPASSTIYWSEETYRIFGVEPGTPPTLELVVQRTHPDDRAAVQATIESAQRDGLDFEHQYRLLLPDGSVKHLHVVAHAVTDDRGRREFVGSVMDITERERAEEGLRESEDRFRTFVDHATDAFFLHDEELLVIDVNRQACASLGYSRDELIGMHPRDFDVGLDEATIGRLADRVAAGENVTFESLHCRNDGTVFPVEVRTGPVPAGRSLYRLALVRDITERKRRKPSCSRCESGSAVIAEKLAGWHLHTEGDPLRLLKPALARKVWLYRGGAGGRRLGAPDLACPEDRNLVRENAARRLGAKWRRFATSFEDWERTVRVPGRSAWPADGAGRKGRRNGNPDRQHRAQTSGEELRAAETASERCVDTPAKPHVHDELGNMSTPTAACENRATPTRS